MAQTNRTSKMNKESSRRWGGHTGECLSGGDHARERHHDNETEVTQKSQRSSEGDQELFIRQED